MREIKFRAWGINSKEFLSPNGKVFGLTLKEIQNIEDISLWEFQQFTGLQDKNGKDIYEGDIVKRIFDINIGEVKFESVSWIVRFGEKLNYYPLENYISNNNCSLEVIGNIYENKELLNIK